MRATGTTRGFLLQAFICGALAVLAGCPSSSPPGITDPVLDDIVGTDATRPDVPDEVTTLPCQRSSDCATGLVCDETTWTCINCRTNLQCGEGMRCSAGSCLPMQDCQSAAHCPDGLVCDPFDLKCVECTRDPDCDPAMRCDGRICVDRPMTCGQSFTCPDGLVCNATTNECVSCLKDGDCPGNLLCDETSHTCNPLACVPRAVACQGNNIATCRNDGSGWDPGTACKVGTICKNGRCESTGTCSPSCAGRECGEDGCDGQCGTCAEGKYCLNGHCEGTCAQSCIGRDCGPDGCGGLCGTCDENAFCGEEGVCGPLCTPRCQGKACGPDGCGKSCGACTFMEYCDGRSCQVFKSCADMFECWTACGTTDEACISKCYFEASPEAQLQYQVLTNCLVKACGQNGTDACYGSAYYGACREPYSSCLSCTPNCTGRQCGDDGCGGQCGACQDGATCGPAGLCPCQAVCGNRECGPNQCGGSCGTCLPTEVCSYQGTCSCLPSCQNQECGADGCGGLCGKCRQDQSCESGRCITVCQPRCVTADGMRMECGEDGCGGQCGYCDSDSYCAAGRCIPQCVPQCFGFDGTSRRCGEDGCGGSCGNCPPGYSCDGKSCIPRCQPSCFARECGFDGCGGQCGTCPRGLVCDENVGKCLPNGQQDGCTTTNFGGCGGCGCEACVCGQDPFCCKTAWDDVCVEECRRCGGCQACIPTCYTATGEYRECGDNGCGGFCGICPDGTTCSDTAGRCLPVPTGIYCPQILDCSLACPSLDIACVQKCMSLGNPASQQVFTTLAQCVMQYCGMPPDVDCAYQTMNVMCQKEFFSCRMDGQVVPM